jgi:hypothetical protein
MNKLEVGDCVIVKDAKPNEIWNLAFAGTITDVIENMDCEVIYVIENQVGDFYEMERDRFYIDGGES